MGNKLRKIFVMPSKSHLGISWGGKPFFGGIAPLNPEKDTEKYDQPCQVESMTAMVVNIPPQETLLAELCSTSGDYDFT